MPGPAVVPAVWLVDVSVKLRRSRIIAHHYKPGALRSLCGQNGRTRGRSFRRPAEGEHHCQACAQKLTTTGRTR